MNKAIEAVDEAINGRYKLIIGALREIIYDSKHNETIQAALAHFKEALSEGWQDIESAPRDGTIIWLRNKTPHRDERHVGFYSENEKCYPWQFLEPDIAQPQDGHTNGLGVNYPPTHWKPLESKAEKMAQDWKDGFDG